MYFVVTDFSPLFPRRRLQNNWQAPAPAPAAATFSGSDAGHAPAAPPGSGSGRDGAAPALAGAEPVNHGVTELLFPSRRVRAKLENTCLVVGLKSNFLLLRM